jgi:valyl-tRNA synthetase
MMGTHFMGDVPFRTVLIHNRVLDEQGAKMSKTKGNVVDPLVLIDEFGADALRFTLALAAGQNRDMRIGPTRVEAGRNFGTKLWNTARFCEMNDCRLTSDFRPAEVKEAVNKWIVSETAYTIRMVTTLLEELRSNEAANTVYHFVYDYFCDWYVELTKRVFQRDNATAKVETRATAAWVLDQILKLLHPFMPFITEELWARTSESPRDTLLIVADWPEPVEVPGADAAKAEMEWLMEVIKGTRSLRMDLNVPHSARPALQFVDLTPYAKQWLTANVASIQSMSGTAEISTTSFVPPASGQFVVDGATVAMPLAGVIDVNAAKERLLKDLKKAEDDIARVDAKLSNEQFVSRAPEEVLTEQRERRAEAASLAARLKEAVQRLA